MRKIGRASAPPPELQAAPPPDLSKPLADAGMEAMRKALVNARVEVEGTSGQLNQRLNGVAARLDAAQAALATIATLQSQVADLTARVAALEAAAVPPVEQPPA